MTRFPYDFDRRFDAFDRLRRLMDRAFDDFDAAREEDERFAGAGFPRLHVTDEGAKIRIVADLPGVDEKNLELSLHQDVLTLRGQREVAPPSGYTVHRQERAALKFARSIALPTKVDPEVVQATLKNGVLHLELTKAAEAKPRTISVRAS